MFDVYLRFKREVNFPCYDFSFVGHSLSHVFCLAAEFPLSGTASLRITLSESHALI